MIPIIPHEQPMLFRIVKFVELVRELETFAMSVPMRVPNAISEQASVRRKKIEIKSMMME